MRTVAASYYFSDFDPARQRRHLREFPNHLLHDIGVTRAEVEAEAAKPFCVPSTRQDPGEEESQ